MTEDAVKVVDLFSIHVMITIHSMEMPTKLEHYNVHQTFNYFFFYPILFIVMFKRPGD